ncbi:MAG: hypothetical protein ACKO2S_13430, partial [Burkholderiaceae bacterium]
MAQTNATDPSETSELFDAGLGRSVGQKTAADWLREKVAQFSARCREASDWIQRKLASLTNGTGTDLHIGAISTPRNFQRHALPAELLQGLHRIDTQKKQAVATADFIESVDIPFNIPVSQQGEDELAFDAYAKLCKQD